MKVFFIIAMTLSFVTITVTAQDDLYFTPAKKKTKAQREAEKRAVREDIAGTYYCGSNRNVDEYNRRGAFASHYEVLGTDSTGNDIIEFVPGDGSYPDSVSTVTPDASSLYSSPSYNYDEDEDYKYSRRMMEYDGYYPYWTAGRWFCSPWFYRSAYWCWNDPWYWNYSWYWNDPWYWNYSWYWNDPWYWHGGHWGHYPHYVGMVHRVYAGTNNHGRLSPRRGISSNARSISRGVQSESNARGQIYNVASSRTGNFSGRRSYSSDMNNSAPRSANFSSRSSSFSGSSFSGGSRGGGGGFSNGGGSSRGGGGSFGGRR